jgi:serine protease Do
MKHHIFSIIAFILIVIISAFNVNAQNDYFEKQTLQTIDISEHIEQLSERIGKSVVQIFVTSYEPKRQGRQLQMSKVRGSGSGVILDPNGYVITNYHVVRGAIRIKVALPTTNSGKPELNSILRPMGDIVEAKIVGIDQETDLALIKIEGSNLPFLTLGNSDDLHPGQIVFAYGSPLGLNNSVSMGVVSSVARQLIQESPMIYIQTDASINPGNSGGPLINMRGDVVGINTMIFSQSGGSEGIGFAAPSNIVKTIYQQLKLNGRVMRGMIGVNTQTITPYLAAGLNISQTWGVIISDAFPGGPADKVGLKPGDIILTLDGKIMENGRQFRINLYGKDEGDSVTLEILRGIKRLTFHVKIYEAKDMPQSFVNMINPEKNLIPRLGIIGLELNDNLLKLLPPIRSKNGILVGALVGETTSWDGDLRTGDVIVSINKVPIYDFNTLKTVTDTLKAGHVCVVHLERDGEYKYVTLEIN